MLQEAWRYQRAGELQSSLEEREPWRRVWAREEQGPGGTGRGSDPGRGEGAITWRELEGQDSFIRSQLPPLYQRRSAAMYETGPEASREVAETSRRIEELLARQKALRERAKEGEKAARERLKALEGRGQEPQGKISERREEQSQGKAPTGQGEQREQIQGEISERQGEQSQGKAPTGQGQRGEKPRLDLSRPAEALKAARAMGNRERDELQMDVRRFGRYNSPAKAGLGGFLNAVSLGLARDNPLTQREEDRDTRELLGIGKREHPAASGLGTFAGNAVEYGTLGKAAEGIVRGSRLGKALGAFGTELLAQQAADTAVWSPQIIRQGIKEGKNLGEIAGDLTQDQLQNLVGNLLMMGLQRLSGETKQMFDSAGEKGYNRAKEEILPPQVKKTPSEPLPMISWDGVPLPEGFRLGGGGEMPQAVDLIRNEKRMGELCYDGVPTDTLDGHRLKQNEKPAWQDLLAMGNDVDLIPVSKGQDEAAADAFLNGVRTELKGMTGSSPKTLIKRIKQCFSKPETFTALVDVRAGKMSAKEAREALLSAYRMGKIPEGGKVIIWTVEGFLSYP